MNVINILKKAEKFYENFEHDNALKEARKVWLKHKTEEVANFLGLLYDQKSMLTKTPILKARLQKLSEKYHREALNINRESLNAYLGLGRLFMHKNKFKFAIQYYENALNIDKRSYDAKNGLGNIYQRTDNPDLAIKWYKDALKVAPRKSIILTNISRSYLKKKNIRLAKNFAKKALEELKQEKRKKTPLIVSLYNELEGIIKKPA